MDLTIENRESTYVEGYNFYLGTVSANSEEIEEEIKNSKRLVKANDLNVFGPVGTYVDDEKSLSTPISTQGGEANFESEGEYQLALLSNEPSAEYTGPDGSKKYYKCYISNGLEVVDCHIPENYLQTVFKYKEMPDELKKASKPEDVYEWINGSENSLERGIRTVAFVEFNRESFTREEFLNVLNMVYGEMPSLIFNSNNFDFLTKEFQSGGMDSGRVVRDSMGLINQAVEYIKKNPEQTHIVNGSIDNLKGAVLDGLGLERGISDYITSPYDDTVEQLRGNQGV